MTMNQYGFWAQKHWKQYRRAEFDRLEDPERFFRDLGNRIAEEIDQRSLAAELAAGIGPSTDYLQKLQTVTSIRTSVESAVLREMAFTEPES